MKYALAKARKLAVELGLNPELAAEEVYAFEKLVREVLTEAHAAAMDDGTDRAIACVLELADKEVPE